MAKMPSKLRLKLCVWCSFSFLCVSFNAMQVCKGKINLK